MNHWSKMEHYKDLCMCQ